MWEIIVPMLVGGVIFGVGALVGAASHSAGVDAGTKKNGTRVL